MLRWKTMFVFTFYRSGKFTRTVGSDTSAHRARAKPVEPDAVAIFGETRIFPVGVNLPQRENTRIFDFRKNDSLAAFERARTTGATVSCSNRVLLTTECQKIEK